MLLQLGKFNSLPMAGTNSTSQQSTPCNAPTALAVQVRLVFDAAPTPALPSGQEDASDEEEDEGDDEEDAGGLALNGRVRKRDAKGHDRGSRAAAVVAMLQQVSEEQVQEIAQVCRWDRHCLLVLNIFLRGCTLLC